MLLPVADGLVCVGQLLCRLLDCACQHSLTVPGLQKLLLAEIAWLLQLKVGAGVRHVSRLTGSLRTVSCELVM